MTLVVQLSDTHFGTEIPAVVHAARRALAILQPDVLVVSGDITQRARRRQFEAARAFLDELPGRVRLVVPGNHDIPLFNLTGRLLAPYAGYRRAFGAREQCWYGPDAGILALDTTSRWRHTRGVLPGAHLARRVATARAQLGPDALLAVCVHQPLATAWPEDRDEVLRHAGRTARALAGLGADLLLSGHVHVPLAATTRDAFPGLDRHFVLAGAGTALSSRTRPGAPNSFNALHLESGEGVRAITLTRFDYDALTHQFHACPATRFVDGHDGWRVDPALAPCMAHGVLASTVLRNGQ